MLTWIRGIFSNKKEKSMDRIIEYYKKRLMSEMEEKERFKRDVFKKMIKYRNKLRDYDLYEFDEEE